MWVQGRKNWRKSFPELEQCIWVHCSSLGEFEQGRPLIERIRKEYPSEKIVLTFFSPSGYEMRKNYAFADSVLYLPLDTPQNARLFIQKIKPKAAIFVKYDFWFCYLQALQESKIPHYLISAVFTKDHFVFKAWAKSFRAIVQQFTQIFVQNKVSLLLLEDSGFNNVTLAGDTRVARVLSIKNEHFENDIIASFLNQEQAFIVGSAWKKDIEIMKKAFLDGAFPAKTIIAPHEINDENIAFIQSVFGEENTAIFTNFNQAEDAQKSVLVLNTIGILAFTYRFASLIYIGGGLGKGIHNTLEPAVYEKPLVFGPKYAKFPEAEYFVNNGIATVCNHQDSFQDILQNRKPLTTLQIKLLNDYFISQKEASTLIINKLDAANVFN